MKILVLAPHPFYQERGTPIAVDLLVRVLAERGDTVHLLTYHEGSDRTYDGDVTIHRIKPPPGVHHIRPGFSLKKLVCDCRMLPAVRTLCRTHDFDVIHAVEESVFMAMRAAARRGTPFVFDMDSSMPGQIVNKCRALAFLRPIMDRVEARAIRRAHAVVPMCDSLADHARAAGARHVTVLRDISLLAADAPAQPLGLRRALDIRGCAFLYVGNLEPYQGIDLLLDSFAAARAALPDAALIIAGGRPDDITTHTRRSRRLGLADVVHFLGPRPVAEMARLFAESDVLVSPRTQGENTPMKIYSYLDSGVPILATDLPTHTQVLTPEVAMLAAPDTKPFADAMVRLAQDAELRRTLANRAKALARECYSYTAFRRTVNDLYDHLAAGN